MGVKKGWWGLMRHANLTKNDMENAEDLVKNFLKGNSLDYALSQPVDIFQLAKEIGFRCFSGNKMEDRFDGAILVDEAEDKKLIAYNPNRTIEQVRFIVAHELSHYMKVKMEDPNSEVVLACRDNRLEKRSPEEQFIDYMGVALLVPKDQFTNDVKMSKEILIEDRMLAVRVLSKKYKVDSIIISRRMCELELWLM